MNLAPTVAVCGNKGHVKTVKSCSRPKVVRFDTAGWSQFTSVLQLFWLCFIYIYSHQRVCFFGCKSCEARNIPLICLQVMISLKYCPVVGFCRSHSSVADLQYCFNQPTQYKQPKESPTVPSNPRAAFEVNRGFVVALLIGQGLGGSLRRYIVNYRNPWIL